jgi:hypothetical protein
MATAPRPPDPLLGLAVKRADALAELQVETLTKDRVNDLIEYAIKQVDDAFRQDPAHRTQPDARYFVLSTRQSLAMAYRRNRGRGMSSPRPCS